MQRGWICMSVAWIWVRTLARCLVFWPCEVWTALNELGPSVSLCLLYPFLLLDPFFNPVSSHYSLSMPRAFFRSSSSVCVFPWRTPGFFMLPFFLFSAVSHSWSSLLPSLVLFHTPHKVAFLSLISLFPRSFLLLLSCAFEIPFSSLALSRCSLPHAYTLAHSVILLLSQN